MSAPLRIESRSLVLAGTSASPSEAAKNYIEKLLKIVPAEAQSLFALGNNIIPSSKHGVLLAWAGFCLLVVIVVRVFGTSDAAAGQRPDWVHVAISSVAFLLWIYTLGVIFPAFSKENPYLSILFTAAFTFLVPYFYKR